MAEINRNANIGAKGLWEWGSEPIKLFRWFSRFQDGRELVEDDERGGRPKSNRTEVNIAAVADLVENYRGIASRMIAGYLNIPETLVLRILREKVVCTFWSALLDTWAKRRSSHILARHYRDGRCRQVFFLTKFLWEMRLVFCLWPRNKATDFWMSWWDNPSAEETEIPEVPHQDHVGIYFFPTFKV
jgi:hypothetical protein